MKYFPIIEKNVIYKRVKNFNKNNSSLINITNNKTVKLNEYSDMIIRYCNGTNNISDIAHNISFSFKDNENNIYNSVEKIVSQLEKEFFIEVLNKKADEKNKRIIPKIYDFKYTLNSVFLEITNKCNLKCSHCYVPDDEFRELEYNNVIKIIDQSTKMGLVNLQITGGEALLYDKIYEIIEYSINKPIRVTLLTNGMIVNEDVVKKLKQLRLNNVQISLDGHCPVIHDEYRNQKGSFNKAVNAINLFKKYNFSIDISSVINKLNIHYIKEIFNLCKSNWDIIPIFGLQLPQGRALTEGKKYQISIIEYKNKMIDFENSIYKFVDELKKTDSEKDQVNESSYRCSAGIHTCAIFSNGDIKPCSDFDVVLGNIKKDDLRTIWESHPFLTKLRNQNIDSINICNECKYKHDCQRGCMLNAKKVWGDYNWPDIKECIYYTLLNKHYSEIKVKSVEDKIQMKVIN